MFAKSILAVLSVLAVMQSGVIAGPVAAKRTDDLTRRTDETIQSPPSFNNYLGLSSMSNFDDFFGQDNFNSFLNEQTIIVQQEEIVCSSVEIELVQQKLSVLVEVAKQVILEQICEVEVQTIVLQQFTSVVSSFGSDLSRQSNRQTGFDSNIASKLGQIYNSDGSLSQSNFGFNGSQIGNSSVIVGGSNWNNTSSPESVKNAKGLAMQAANCTVSSNSTSS